VDCEAHGWIGSILRNYSTLQNALDEIKLGHDKYAAKRNGKAIRMDRTSQGLTSEPTIPCKRKLLKDLMEQTPMCT